MADKVEVCALPAPFLNVFRRLAPPSNARPLAAPEMEPSEQESQESINEYKAPEQND